jgi:hypothetical protein
LTLLSIFIPLNELYYMQFRNTERFDKKMIYQNP